MAAAAPSEAAAPTDAGEGGTEWVDDDFEVDLGLLEAATPPKKVAALDGSEALTFCLPWEEHSGASVPLLNGDWHEWDGGKVGGRPVWLDPAAMPSAKECSCATCGHRLRFLLQLYAPADEGGTVQHSCAFHRMLYVFTCASARCVAAGGVTVLRQQLPRVNAHFQANPQPTSGPLPHSAYTPPTVPPRWCGVCGFCASTPCTPAASDATHVLLPAATATLPKECCEEDAKYARDAVLAWLADARCPVAACSTPCAAALAKWLLGRLGATVRLQAGQAASDHTTRKAVDSILSGWQCQAEALSSAAFVPLKAAVACGAVHPEHDLWTEPEATLEQRRATEAARDAALVAKVTAAGGGVTEAAPGSSPEEEFDITHTTQAELMAATGAVLSADATMRRFKSRVSHEPGQVVRFARWNADAVLWVGEAKQPGATAAWPPPCAACSAPRAFEFQVMPQLLNAISRDDDAACLAPGADSLDFATIAVATCTASCQAGRFEAAWVQPADTHVDREG